MFAKDKTVRRFEKHTFRGEEIPAPYQYKINEIDEFYKGEPKTFTDGGHGVTEESIKYFKKLRGKLGEIVQINIDSNREYDMEINCSAGLVLLSGVTCGYGGTGPNGTLKLLEMIGLDSEDYRQKVFANNHVMIDLRDKREYY